jgi:hypothetical protein
MIVVDLRRGWPKSTTIMVSPDNSKKHGGPVAVERLTRLITARRSAAG